ncbi:patatin-like phospholipase family protein [candidate division WOR-3 bacterium]|nr:patatin-like phospholipase family protein [candidate division WOR-3 bacterium]
MSRIGLCITGGDARLAQQIVLCEYLIEEREKSPQVMAGTSVGGLIAVALDCILSSRWYWERFNNVIFNLKNSDVYRQRFLAQMTRQVVSRKLCSLFDAEPERLLFRKLLDEIGVSTISALKLPTYICAVENETGKEVFWNNLEPEYSNLKLEDVLLATSSVAFKFDPVPVPSPDGPCYVDGAEGKNWAPIEPVLSHSLDEVYIITPARYTTPPKIDSTQLVDNTLAAIMYLVKAVLELQLDFYPRANPRTDYYLIQPVFDERFGPMDFETGEKEYQLARKWIELYFDKIRPLSKEWPPERFAESIKD